MAGISSKSVGKLQNKYKYNGRELQNQEFIDGSGLEWNDFGARMYDHQIGKWYVVDPLAGRYKDISTYAFVKNNPINNIEIDGRYFDEKNKIKAKKYETAIDKRINDIQKEINKLVKDGNDIGDRRDRIDELIKSKGDIADMRKAEKTEYRYGSANDKSNPAGIGNPVTKTNTETNNKGNEIVTMYTDNNMGSILHEQRHGGQNARKDYDVNKPETNKVELEISTYRAEYSWDGQIDYFSHNIDQSATNNRLFLDMGVPPPEAIRRVTNINQVTKEMVRDVGEIRNVNGINIIIKIYPDF